MNEVMEDLGDPLEDLKNVNIPGIKQEIVKDEICEEDLTDFPNYVTIKNELVIDKLDIDLKQEIDTTHSESQLAKSEHTDEDSEETEPLSPLKIKTECEFEEFDQPEQIPVEDIDSILFDGTETKVKSEFGNTEDSNEQTDEVLEKDSTSHDKTQPHTVKTLFKCEVCGKGFVKEAVKNRHMCVHFGKGPVPCTVCGEGIDKRDLYVQHYGTHLEDLSGIYCEICYRTFSCQADLDTHSTSHQNLTTKFEPDDDVTRANKKRYQCHYCPKNFLSRSDFLGHESLHGKPLFQCSICLKNFSKAFELEKHQRIHTGSKPFSCEICSKSFVQRGSLTVHQKIAHSDEKSFQCSLCPMNFAYSSSLKRHLRNHRGERPYKCKECSKSFKLRYLLVEHVMNHMDELPFSCKECPKKFGRLSTLKKHSSRHYSNNSSARPLQCGTCDRRFTKSDSLKRHETSHDEDEEFKCTSCWKTFKNEDGLKSHQAAHVNARVIERPFECHLCSRRFTTKNRRDMHVETHPKKPIQCEMCDKQFVKKNTLRCHMRVHSKERFSCEVCPKIFCSTRNVKRHMRIHSEMDEEAK